MAGEFVTLVFDAMLDVEPSEKLVAVALADAANRTGGGRAYPSNATLARRTSLGERQVRDWLRSLEKKGWIERVAYSRGGRGMATVYRLQLERMIACVSRSQNPDTKKKAAVQFRVLSRLPGALSPGFVEEFARSMLQYPAVQQESPAAELHETRRSTAPQPEVEPESIEPEVEPEGARASRSLDAQPRLIKTDNWQPEKRQHMSREEQIAAARSWSREKR